MTRIVVLFSLLTTASASESRDIWPGLAPGELTRHTGTVQPFRPEEDPPVTRVTEITRPTFTVHRPRQPNGTAVVILPGGGFRKVVPDKEGTEAAEWLNRHGVTAWVLSYRTSDGKSEPAWTKALQDAQRCLSLMRSEAEQHGLRKDRIGLVGFSAGGQVAARVLGSPAHRAYPSLDEVDDVPFRPDFALLVYPWNISHPQDGRLVDGVQVTEHCPPVFLVHTDDDRSSSVGAALFYIGLRNRGIPAALHVYGSGGHGYGLRPVTGSQIATWPDHAAHWLKFRGLLDLEE